ncbi:unnamed protein product [Aspergillus oryzae]|uniref:Unnamed protein product n=2 Tax=Aspergillus oryzae TaxID=5062 RepID=A0AAN5BSS2_ASPOZ|nr:unnamed protein product [Aspergillus oryzae]GMF85429.1 unnamed protein product [Aspergillus oryzae]GMG04199.1 unnamed protein product [Aspergillus oryzae]GMG23258.1 unnamed protein product [Aspergillus oryzae]GMG42775.1 unnamed protein product [Aspergillus oryzae var. brunneus]
MDHIEPVDGSDGPSAEAPSPPSTTQPTSLQRRQRATSLRSRRPTIRLQRLPSLENAIPQIQSGVSRGTGNVSSINVASPPPAKGADEDSWQGNRRRSSSEPRPGRWSAPNPSALPRLPPDQMHPLMEEPTSPINLAHSSRPFPEVHPSGSPPPRVQRRGSLGLLRWTSEAAMNRFSRNRVSASGAAPSSGADTTDNEYHPHVVDVLDVIESSESTGEETTETEEGEETFEKSPEGRPSLERPLTSLSAVLGKQDPQFAVLPEGSNLEGWTARDIEELNDHVRHMLHSRRSKFKRAMKGFGKYVSKRWINVGGRQLYIINVIDNVLVALFAIMGDGLAPFRAIDTYHMCFIAHYTFQTWKVRRKRQLPDLKDKNDLPTRREIDVDVEFGDTPKDEEYEFTVLNRLQQQKLVHHQTKLSKSHTFYKPHETLTHHAFPLRMLIAIVVLLDCHSLLQIALGACTWGISYHHRPFALTTVILCCSITCNITGGVLIMVGDRRTRKKDVVERLFREQLTKEAMKKVCKKKQKRQQKIEEEDEPRLSVSTRPQPYDGT